MTVKHKELIKQMIKNMEDSYFFAHDEWINGSKKDDSKIIWKGLREEIKK